MNRLLAIVVLLATAQTAWGQYAYVGYNAVGASTDDDQAGRTYAMPAHTTTSLRFAAQSGDIVDTLRFYGVSIDSDVESMAVAIYTVDVGNGKPDDFLFSDTITPVLNDAAQWWAVNTNYTLTGSATICVAYHSLRDDFIQTTYDTGGSEDEEHKAGEPTDPWGAEATDGDRKYSLVAVVDTSARSAGAAAPITVGGNTTNGGSLTQ